MRSQIAALETIRNAIWLCWPPTEAKHRPINHCENYLLPPYLLQGSAATCLMHTAAQYGALTDTSLSLWVQAHPFSRAQGWPGTISPTFLGRCNLLPRYMTIFQLTGFNFISAAVHATPACYCGFSSGYAALLTGLQIK